MRLRKIAVVAMAFASVAVLSACSSKSVNVRAPSLGLADVPAGGITKISDVKIKPSGGGNIQFEGVSSSDFTMEDVMAVLYCRAGAYQVEKGFSARQVEALERQSTNNPATPQIVIAVLSFYKDSVPAGVKPMTSDWCDKVPEAAQ